MLPISILTYCSMVVDAMLNAISKETRHEIRVQCEMEKRRPFTLNEHYFIQCKANKYTQLINLCRKAQSKPQESPAPPGVPASQYHVSTNHKVLEKQDLLNQLAFYGFKVKSFEQLARLHDPDEYEEELRVISDVYAYFKVAYKRMIDAIPMRIEQHFVHGFSERVRDRLICELGLVGEGGLQKCKMFAKDPPEIQGRREELLRQRDILNNASNILRSI